MATEPGKEWVGTPLDADRIDPRGIVEIVVEFEEGEEVLTPKLNERFGSYDLNEAARYIYFLSNHILNGSRLDGERQARLVGRHRGEEAGLGRPRGSEGQPGADPARICLRYEDDRKVCFVPEAEEEFFSQDDVHRVVGMLHKGSEALEWSPAPEGIRARRGTRARGHTIPGPSEFWGCLILAVVGLPRLSG